MVESPSTLQHTGSTINIAARRKHHLHYQKGDEEKGELTSGSSHNEGRRRIDAGGALSRRPGDVGLDSGAPNRSGRRRPSGGGAVSK
ncbi:hypothetical protein E2562_034096 [Oryza meyeriana var. granulata]|uniref:Uncharacterized protein n=1 Tax=Oryza meyeriana var. granulata TaxID=110450 RepID=A0A6G1E732_9ORYZ|nr:hypothetical protein E2562_034096 [Oryza meyeriana var. granulata]